jgi:hypothetical protein
MWRYFGSLLRLYRVTGIRFFCLTKNKKMTNLAFRNFSRLDFFGHAILVLLVLMVKPVSLPIARPALFLCSVGLSGPLLEIAPRDYW